VKALLNAEQAAELLGVPKSWVFAEARADRIPHVRLGRYVRFDGDALDQWWRGRARGPGRLGLRLTSSAPAPATTGRGHGPGEHTP